MTKISDFELRERLSQVRLLSLDVDGVLTDGGVYYTDSGEEFKKFNVKDGQGLKLLMQAGIEVAILTASSSTSTWHRANKLGISNVFIAVEDKLSVLKDLCKKLEINLSQVAHVGDDINDLPILELVGCPIATVDAMPETQSSAIYTTKQAGGKGAVREVCNLLLKYHNADIKD
jgi:3-deoxy-D-manno-octulosonate 8-phosphate phosphatase (KDO 8-P phosphatase)